MLRVILLLLVAAVLFGQTAPPTPEKAPPQDSPIAPPEVDTALRARITQFYQLEVEGKFSKALELVAEDTKDVFVGSSKPSYQSFEIKSIRYSEDFTKAEALMMVNRLMAIQGFIGRPLPTKLTSRWKLENSKWCFYVDPQKDLQSTPFGGLPVPGMGMPRPGAGGPPGAPPAMPSQLPAPPSVTADKTSVQLKSAGPSAGQVTISNPSPWPVALMLSDPKIDGLTVKLDPLTVAPQQKAILSIQSKGGLPVPQTPITIMVTVRQTNQSIPIKVSFTN